MKCSCLSGATYIPSWNENHIVLTALFLYPCKPSSSLYSPYLLNTTGFVSLKLVDLKALWRDKGEQWFEKNNELQQSGLRRKGIFLVNVFLNGSFSVWCFARVFGSHLESSADLCYIVGLAMTICVCVVL